MGKNMMSHEFWQTGCEGFCGPLGYTAHAFPPTARFAFCRSVKLFGDLIHVLSTAGELTMNERKSNKATVSTFNMFLLVNSSYHLCFVNDQHLIPLNLEALG